MSSGLSLSKPLFHIDRIGVRRNHRLRAHCERGDQGKSAKICIAFCQKKCLSSLKRIASIHTKVYNEDMLSVDPAFRKHVLQAASSGLLLPGESMSILSELAVDVQPLLFQSSSPSVSPTRGPSRQSTSMRSSGT